MRHWIVAIAAGALLSSGAADVQAQGNSGRARQNERPRAEKQQKAEKQERERERDRLRAERERETARRGVTQATARATGPVYGTRTRTDRDDDRYDRDRDRYDDRYDPRRDDPWYDGWDPRRDQDSGWEIWDRDRRDQRKGNGPQFCRSGGRGHPVFGREWCRDKGYGNVSGRDIWGDIILRQPRDRRYEENVGRSVLQDILGAVVLGRFDGYTRQYGSGLTGGQWLNDGGALALQLFAGRTPVARLYDLNRDGRVDRVMLRR